MIEIGSIVELSNGKKYMLTASSVENFKTFYLALEVDYVTEEPIDKSMFFMEDGDSLIPITGEKDISYLQTIFVDKFIEENIDFEDKETV